MSRYLITPSLHDAWRFYRLLESKEKSDFLDTLLKKPIEPTEAMLAGRAFEDDVVRVCGNPTALKDLVGYADMSYAQCVREVAEECRGGLWQERIMFDATICGMSVLVYGKADNIKRDWIRDVKFSGSYELGKYTESVQHATYMVGTGISHFRYLISDGKSVWKEDYHLTDGMERSMWAEYAGLIEGIMDDPDFRAAFLENWKSFGDAGNEIRANIGVGKYIMAG